MSRAEAEVTVKNELGLHLRAAASFAKIADRYQSHVQLCRAALAVNGKSILSLVTLNAPRGTGLRIVAEGDDAEAAVQALAALIEDGFGESP